MRFYDSVHVLYRHRRLAVNSLFTLPCVYVCVSLYSIFWNVVLVLGEIFESQLAEAADMGHVNELG